MEKTIFALLVVLAVVQAGPVNKQIVSGEDAVACEFPHMVWIRVVYSDKVSSCGASLLSNKHILTAAHCLDGDVKSITAHVGTTIKGDPDAAVPIKQWTNHRGYKITDTVINDVALMQLSRPIKFSSCVQPIDLPKKGDVFKGVCIAAGWGKTGKSGIYPTKLQRTDINIIPTSQCQKSAYGISAEQHICVGNRQQNGRNVCNGDSGGGLICKRPDGTPVVAGVASYVYNCDEGFGVFANTENFLTFIKDHMDVWQ